MRLALVKLLIELAAKSRSTYAAYKSAVHLLPDWEEFDKRLKIASVNHPIAGTYLEQEAIKAAIADFIICEKFARCFRMAFTRPILKKEYDPVTFELTRVQLRYQEPIDRLHLIELFSDLSKDTADIDQELKKVKSRSRNIKRDFLETLGVAIDRGDTPNQIIALSENGDRVAALGDSASWVLEWEEELVKMGFLK